MSVEQTIYTLLSTDADLTALVSTHIYPVVLPDNSQMPAISYQVISTAYNPTFDSNGLAKKRLQVDSWATTYSDSIAIREAIFSALSGNIGNSLVIQPLTQQDMYDRELLQYRAMTEFYIFYTP